MLKHIRLVQEIGQFQHISIPQIELAPLTLVYAENGRGKTTLVSIFRSLQSGNAISINERRRLGSTRLPQVALTFTDETNTISFSGQSWSKSKPNIAIFDEQFVNGNIYSGLVVQSPQRKGMHGLIVGQKGVALLKTLQEEIAKIEIHNKKLRKLASSIPAKMMRGLTIEEFCALPSIQNIDERIEESQKAISAAQQQEAIKQIKDLVELQLSAISGDTLSDILAEKIADVAAEAEHRVRSHLQKLGRDGEAWLAAGELIRHHNKDLLEDDCPYCAQELGPSPVAADFSHYFSVEYEKLKNKILRVIDRIDELYGDVFADKIVSEIGENETKALFWSEFIGPRRLLIDIPKLIQLITEAHSKIRSQFEEKSKAPLDVISLSESSISALQDLSVFEVEVKAYNAIVREINESAAVVREAMADSNLDALKTELIRLEATKDRFDSKISKQCDAYLAEAGAKKSTESRRAKRKRDLDAHLQNAFPAFQDAINLYLRRLNSGFRIDGVKSLNTRQGPSCVYSVVVDGSPNHPIPIQADVEGEPSFKTVLSTGDRSTLALATFFATLSLDDDRDTKVIFIDDPINSMDEHRTNATVSEIRRLVSEVKQVIVFSHSRPLVCHLWESPGQTGKQALSVVRTGSSSGVKLWDVSSHGASEHDKRHAKLRAFVTTQSDDPRSIAESLRPTCEAFLRVAYPEHFPPGTLLGPFAHICSQHVGRATQILSQQDVDELQALKEYANRFHHDTNPAWQTADINDSELLAFVIRTLSFTSKS